MSQEEIDKRRAKARRKYHRIKHTPKYIARIRRKAKRHKQKRYFKYLSEILRRKYSIGIGAWDLWKIAKRQQLICPLTGRRLTRKNISIDHSVPKSRGGTNDISNLRFVDYHANLAKAMFSEDELLQLAKDIVTTLS